MIYVAGGLNATSGHNWGFVRADPEEVRRLNPDIIIFHLDPWLRMDPDVVERRGWSGLSAVREGRVNSAVALKRFLEEILGEERPAG